MCTAATYLTDHFFFGRNLDYERGFGERVTVTPRSFPLPMRHLNEVTQHYAMIGMASVQAGYPLYYDAVNEKGLCIAGLNFVSSAVYRPCPAEGRGVAQFELIPWLLAKFRKLHPEIKIDVLVGGYELAAALEEERVQLALVEESCGRGFYWTPLTDAPLVAVVPPDFPWQEDTIPLERLLQETFLSCPEQYVARLLPPGSPLLEVTASDDAEIGRAHG